MRVAELIAENERRKLARVFTYDPILGVGSEVARVAVQFDTDVTLYLPVAMHEKSTCAEALSWARSNDATLLDYAHQHKLVEAEFIEAFGLERAKWDFEYWAAKCVWVENEDADEGESLFILRKPQRKLLGILIDLWFSGKPCFVIILKARQWGGSTLVQLFLAWVQMWHAPKHWHIAIAALQESQAVRIRGMYLKMIEKHPRFMPIQYSGYKGDSGTLQLGFVGDVFKGSRIRIGGTYNPQALRSDTISGAHLSEVGLWTDTTTVSAKSLYTSLVGSLKPKAQRFLAIESTANGEGGFFHDEWISAESGQSAYKPFFAGWQDHEDYAMPVTDVASFVADWYTLDGKPNEQASAEIVYERRLFERHDCTLEQIAFYRAKRRMMPASERELRMMREYPTTPQEAFKGSGSPVFVAEHVDEMRKSIMPPKQRGNFVARGVRDRSGFDQLRIIDNEFGDILIWRLPDDTYEGKIDLTKRKYLHRFVASYDPGGSKPESDWHVVRVLDRAPTTWGARPEIVASARYHLTTEKAVWQAMRLAYMYDQALFIVESNLLYRDKTDDGKYEASFDRPVLQVISDEYPNAFYRRIEDSVKNEVVMKVGVHMGRDKASYIANFEGTLEDIAEGAGYIERWDVVPNEANWYEQKKKDGTFGAIMGKNDDAIMATMILDYVIDRHLPPVQVIELQTMQVQRKNYGAVQF